MVVNGELTLIDPNQVSLKVKGVPLRRERVVSSTSAVFSSLFFPSVLFCPTVCIYLAKAYTRGHTAAAMAAESSEITSRARTGAGPGHGKGMLMLMARISESDLCKLHTFNRFELLT